MSETTCGSCGRPTAGANLCVKCQQTLAIGLANIAAYYEDLSTVAAKQTRYGSGQLTRGTPGKEQPLPIDARFADVIGDGTEVRWGVWNSVVTWCRILMEESPELAGPTCHLDCLHRSCATVRRRRWPRNTVRSMVAYFDRQFRTAVQAEWAAEFYDEMLFNENRLRKLIDRPVDRWYAGKCSVGDDDVHCKSELYAVAGAKTIACPGCGFEHDVAYRREVLLKEAEQTLVTATEAAQALMSWTDYDGTETKLVDRIGKWRDRDKLEVRDVTSLNGRDRHLYLLGDIIDLLTKAARRKPQEAPQPA